MNYFLLLQMKYELLQRLESCKENKKGRKQSNNTDFFMLSRKEMKPHMLQHMSDEIEEISGHRAIRDTEMLEHFVGHEGLKDLWPKISKRYSTDMEELCKAHLSFRHAIDLHNRLIRNTLKSTKTRCQRKSDSSCFEKNPFINGYISNSSLNEGIHSSIRIVILQAELATHFSQTRVQSLYTSSYNMYKDWQNGEAECYICKGLRRCYADENFSIHADKEYRPYSRSRNRQMKQTSVPIFSVVEAEVYDEDTGTIQTRVVRVLAILEFMRQENKDVEYIFMVGLMETSISTRGSLIPYDIYRYQRDPKDHKSMKKCFLHGNSFLKPVFHIAESPTTIDNCVNITTMTFFVITVDRWYPSLEQVRNYQDFYCSEQNKGIKRNGWTCFHNTLSILNFHSS
jgi:hypothetical protein